MRPADQRDLCPHCQIRLEITCVKFRLAGATMVFACPNCGIAFVDDRSAAKPSSLDPPKKDNAFFALT